MGGPRLANAEEPTIGLIISTLYLHETAVNIQHQHVVSKSICAGQTKRSAMTGAVQ
jgi:hypothetical protein